MALRRADAAAGLLLLALALGSAGCGEREAERPAPAAAEAAAAPPPPPAYVGAEQCRACHRAEAGAWRGSDHDRAMEEASATSVLGRFDGASLEHFGTVSTFSRRDGRYAVRTRGADGALHDYDVAYTFGFDPLQQYLVRFPGGRLQALPTAWDSRPAAAGGQRWFHLHPDEPVPPDDVLHWTKLAGNWNSECADCHSTNLRKGYDPARDSFATSWSDLDVACEACHGPGSRHVAWAATAPVGAVVTGSGGDRGLVVDLGRHGARWVFDADAAIAHREPPRIGHVEVETCAPCHARRSLLREGHVAGESLLDAFRPALLEPGLYFADGQILDEVYVYGSFLQSRMYAAGVTCSDCHDPHTLRLRAEGNAVCGQCHRAIVFDTRAHHHHEPGTPGAACVSCHMPARTYMIVDDRRDHGFRVPRPDLSVAIGTPNACNGCHGDRTPAWAAEQVAAWFPHGRSGTPHWAEALDAGRRALPGAGARLVAVAGDRTLPGIVRATAFAELLAAGPGPEAAAAVRDGLADGDPLVRLGALDAAEGLPPPARLAAVAPLLRDPLLAVRAEAGRLLADVPAPLWRPGERAALADALADYRAVQAASAERPEAHLNLGLLDQRLGDPEAARREYETAMRLAPWFVPAYVDLADLERAAGRDAEGEALLRRALSADPENASVHYALGLLLIRSGHRDEALAELERAALLAPDEPRYAYARALALHERGETERALEVLTALQARRPGDRDVLVALATLSREAGRRADAIRWARALAEAFPGDDAARSLLAELEGSGPPPAPKTP